MRLPANAELNIKSHSHQDKYQLCNATDTGEELYVGEDGLVSVLPVDNKSLVDNLQVVLERREREVRQAAEYGLGLLEHNEELQMQVTRLIIQLETKTDELSVERDTWQRRLEHAQQETVQWKAKFTRVEEEKMGLVDEFDHFVNCDGRGQDTDGGFGDGVSMSSGRKDSHHLDTIAQLQTDLHEVRAAERSKETELRFLRQWKEVAEQQQQETLECEVSTVQSDILYRKKMEQELSAAQRTISERKYENDALCKATQQHEADMRALKKQLHLAEEVKGDTLVHSNRISEELLSSESRCKRLQRELELLEHVSYFSQAIIECDDEESDVDDETIEVNDIQAVVISDTDQVKNIDSKCRANDAGNRIMPSPLNIKRRRSFHVAAATTSSPYPTNTAAEDGQRIQGLKSEKKNSHEKLHHYFHLTALSIIHENNLIERCFNSSSRLTIDMWYREIIAKEVPFLMWHSWLIKRISEVAASVQSEDGLRQRSTSSSKSSIHGFLLRKISGSATDLANDSLLSPLSVSSSPASSPVARARAFFRLLRKNTRAGAGASSEAVGSPAR